jgi:hypothetical protein
MKNHNLKGLSECLLRSNTRPSKELEYSKILIDTLNKRIEVQDQLIEALKLRLASYSIKSPLRIVKK